MSTDPAEADKTQIARGLVQSKDWAWSAQVAAEFVRAGTSPRKSKPLSHAEARRWVETWMAFPMAPVDGPLVLEAVQISDRFQTSHFDAQILAAAKRMGCARVYSEDLIPSFRIKRTDSRGSKAVPDFSRQACLARDDRLKSG